MKPQRWTAALLTLGVATSLLPTVARATEPLDVASSEPSPADGHRSAKTPRLAQVDDDPGAGSDGVYGRFDGDFSWLAAAGLEYDGRDQRSRVLAALTFRYFTAVGTYVAYRQALVDDDPTTRILSFGVQLEPLFLARWSANAETGPALWDLTIDSLGLSAGAFLAEPARGDFGSEKGLELGLGFGVPLLARAGGPWLRARGVLRMSNEHDAAPGLWLTLGFQGFVDVGLANAFDRRL